MADAAAAFEKKKDDEKENHLESLIKLLDGHVARIEHHEELEYRYILWFTSIIGVLIAAAAQLIARDPTLHGFAGCLCSLGAILSVVALRVHKDLMGYIDPLVSRRRAIEWVIGCCVGGRIGAKLKRKSPSKKLRWKFQAMFFLCGAICSVLALYAFFGFK